MPYDASGHGRYTQLAGEQPRRIERRTRAAPLIGSLRPVTIDDSPHLLEASYRLRYQVYCLERHFLEAEDYPNQSERDAFDPVSTHVGVVDAGGTLVATARIVPSSSAGLPLLLHCALPAHQAVLGATGNMVVELSRVCISRRFSRRRQDVFYAGPDASAPDGHALPSRDRRDHRDDVFTLLVTALYQATKRMGATHWVIAIEKSLLRRVARYGLPFRLAGPDVDYWGIVAPHIMVVAELDQLILARRFPLLDDFLEGLEPALRPEMR